MEADSDREMGSWMDDWMDFPMVCFSVLQPLSKKIMEVDLSSLGPSAECPEGAVEELRHTLPEVGSETNTTARKLLSTTHQTSKVSLEFKI